MQKRALVQVQAQPQLPAQVSLEWLAEAIDRSMNHGRNPHTIRSNQAGIAAFQEWAGVKNLKELLVKLLGSGLGPANMLVNDYRTYLLEKERPNGVTGYAPSTVKRRLDAVRSIVKAARFAGAVQWDLEVLSVPIETYRDTSGPGTEAFAKVIVELEQEDDPISIRDRAILILIHDAALRRDEAASLDLEHVDWNHHRVWVKAKKRSQRVDVPISSEIENTLRDWIKVRGSEPGPLFKNFDPAHKGKGLSGTSIWRVVNNRGLGHTHGLRHLGITEVLELSNGNLIEAMKFARHKDPKTTMIYNDNLKKRSATMSSKLAELRKKYRSNG